MGKNITRRDFLKDCSIATTGSLIAAKTACSPKPEAGAEIGGDHKISIDPSPRFEISPYMYMQFMEPLGNTDGSVEAGWDYDRDDWREDLIETVRDLAPDSLRWGGAFIRYYKWREGVGPVKRRPPMFNYVWGGRESNRVGTHEIVDFCRRVGAEPLMCTNLLSDGVRAYWKTIHGEDRRSDAQEAADWVSYANDPDSRERIAHGQKEPYNIRLWQLGNESSYLYEDGFPLKEAVAHARDFARAMKERDPSIEIIGWGDVRNPEKLRPDTPKDDPDIQFWAPEMLQGAGEFMDHIAMHMMGIYPKDDDILTGFEYWKDPERAWAKFLELGEIADFRLQAMKDLLDSLGSEVGIAVTEGHLSLSPYNANQSLTHWLSAAYHARVMITYLKHADRVKICTGADFCGNRWTVNAVMMPVPRGKSFLLPVGSIMRLFKKYKGTHGVSVDQAPADLDVAASRVSDKVYIHVLNTRYDDPVEAELSVAGTAVQGGRVYEIAPESPMAYVFQNTPDVFQPVEKEIPPGPAVKWTFPKASVSVVELDIQE